MNIEYYLRTWYGTWFIMMLFTVPLIFLIPYYHSNYNFERTRFFLIFYGIIWFIMSYVFRDYSKQHGYFRNYLFFVDSEYRDNLSDGSVPDKLMKAFAKNGYPLSKDATIKNVDNKRWMINDEESNYLVKDIGDTLLIFWKN